MNQEALECYVLFPNHETGLQLHKLLKEEGIKCTITPTPREASKCCGISILIAEEDQARVRQIIMETKIEITDIVLLPKRKNPLRNKFC